MPMLVTESGIVAVARLVQLAKAYSPILVTESADIVTDARLLQEWKAFCPIVATP